LIRRRIIKKTAWSQWLQVHMELPNNECAAITRKGLIVEQACLRVVAIVFVDLIRSRADIAHMRAEFTCGRFH